MSKLQAQDSTHFSWCPDGEHIVTATCSPRLRVGNGFSIWHYTGSVLHKQEVASGLELWEVRWQLFPDGTFPERTITYQAAPSELGSTQAAPKQAYRPPALRHLPAKPSARLVSSRFTIQQLPADSAPEHTLHECVFSCDVTSVVCLSARGGASSEPASWRESCVQSGAEKPEKTRSQESSQTGELLSANQTAPSAEQRCGVFVQDSKAEAPSAPAPACQSQSELSAGEPETDKKIKNIKKVKMA